MIKPYKNKWLLKLHPKGTAVRRMIYEPPGMSASKPSSSQVKYSRSGAIVILLPLAAFLAGTDSIAEQYR